MLNNKGFTFLEIIITVVIIAILAFAAVPRMINTTDMRLGIAKDKVLSDVKYAREYATNHNCMTLVRFYVNLDTYAIYENLSGSWQIMNLPGTAESFVVALNTGQYNGVIIKSADFEGDFEFAFNALGTPYRVIGSSTSSMLTVPGILVLGHGGGPEEHTITITPVTGNITLD